MPGHAGILAAAGLFDVAADLVELTTDRFDVGRGQVGELLDVGDSHAENSVSVESAFRLVRSDAEDAVAGRRQVAAAGHKVRRGPNDIRPGIAAVTARVRSGRLKVHTAGCPNLVAEARLYRYPTETERTRSGENPTMSRGRRLTSIRNGSFVTNVYGREQS